MVRALVLLCAVALCCAGRCSAQHVVWLEAEQFDKPGGWVNDPQFVDLMGSPYLLANGVGRPVEDAKTTARIPAPGRYTLWVRCKNWLPQYSPGRFQVLVGGKPSPTVFGTAPTDRWHWVEGGTFELPAGPVEVVLHDLTGWWARCDALVLAVGFRPSDDSKLLAQQRIAYGGLSANVRRMGPYDVVVVGGGLAGCAAAVAAARHGCSVALIQDRPVLGGNASVEIQVPPGGDNSGEPLDPKETGIIEEFDPWPGRHRGQSQRIEKVVRAAGVELFLNTRATGVTMRDEQTIEAVLAQNVHTGERFAFFAPLFIDCTGDGWVGFWAGAEFRQGREGRDEFGESLAPEKPDNRTMGSSLYNARFVTYDHPVPFRCPPWAYQWTSCADFQPDPPRAAHVADGQRPPGMDDLARGLGRHPGPDGGYHTWWVELGGMHDTIRDAEWIRDELFRINIGLWDHVKNHCPKYRQRNANRELVWINHILGKRESRRLLGDYVLSQRDYEENIVHPDTVAYGGWGIDVHNPQGFWARSTVYFVAYRRKVSIPFRCLYSRNIANLMMAGRDISATHVALGGVRVMRTTCLMGQAVGTAAAIAKKYATTPRGIYQRHIKELQQTLLRDGCYLIGVKNEDPDDLARTATVFASSVARAEDLALLLDGTRVTHELNFARAAMFRAPQEQVEAISLFLRSELSQPRPLVLTLRAAPALGDFSATEDIATARAEVPPKSAGWVRFPLRAALQPDRFYYIFLPRTPGISWDLFPAPPAQTTRAYGGPNWKRMTGCYKFRLHPGDWPAQPAGQGTPFAPENVINGYNRAVAGNPNSWMPDPSASLPQWLELRFAKPVRFAVVHVTFQRADIAPAGYELQVPRGPRWATIAAVRDNALRRRVHTFEPVTAERLRLVITAPPKSGKPPAVCEIRVYREAK